MQVNTVTIGITKKMGDYQSAKVEITATISEDDSYSESIEDLLTNVENALTLTRDRFFSEHHSDAKAALPRATAQQHKPSFQKPDNIEDSKKETQTQTDEQPKKAVPVRKNPFL